MSFHRCGLRRSLWILALALTATAPRLQAQYFGRNKVQYEKLDWHVLKTEHFDIYFYSDEQAAAKDASRLAERWITRHSAMFKHELSGRQPLILYASPTEFQQTNAIEGDLGEGTGGVTEALRRRIVLPVGGTLGDLDHVIGHELTHAFQYDITGRGGSDPGHGQGFTPDLQAIGQSALLPLPVRPRASGLRGGTLGGPGDWATAAHGRTATGDGAGHSGSARHQS